MWAHVAVQVLQTLLGRAVHQTALCKAKRSSSHCSGSGAAETSRLGRVTQNRQLRDVDQGHFHLCIWDTGVYF